MHQYMVYLSSTQKTVAFSSGESELIAAVKTSCEAIGAVQLPKDPGRELGAMMMVDSMSAIGIVHIRGNGGLRPVRVGQQWVNKGREWRTHVHKSENTKDNGRSDVERHMRHMERLSQRYVQS